MSTEAELNGQGLESLAGYNGSIAQILGHDQSGKLRWFSVDLVEPIVPLSEVVGPSIQANVTGSYTAPIYPIEAE